MCYPRYKSISEIHNELKIEYILDFIKKLSKGFYDIVQEEDLRVAQLDQIIGFDTGFSYLY